MRTHYGPWQPGFGFWIWISNQHQKHKSGRGPSSEHFWQAWLKSVQRFQRRRFKCEKLTDGWTLTHDKSSHGLWPGELKNKPNRTRYNGSHNLRKYYLRNNMFSSACQQGNTYTSNALSGDEKYNIITCWNLIIQAA